MDKDTKILILGAKGMLGQDLAKVLVDFDLTLWDKEEIDISDQNQVDSKITRLNPRVVINCAAYTAVDDCEIKKDMALQLNNQAVGYLALISKKIGAVLVQISTDYVFNGQNQKGYTEDSQEFGPVNFYGESKLLGEKTLKNIAPNYYLIRTSWLYGKSGKNFVETMLKLGQEAKELKVVNDQFGKPTYTVDLAKQILYILSNNLAFGIYHATNETKQGGISWYEFSQKIFELANLKVNLKPCSSMEYPRPAKRPAYSSLLNTKLPPLRNWEEVVKEYLAAG
ncbi:MAG: dTDP-4-dehydrorhamnose reductase [Candidatus Buchananbacteria bacterium RBG_13_36_9]|uniref:dTDP-4-dehydrorhamnose reductase n=1 Tax=Candidatus Buchananbacteria bacterium RBG_13_36_9 TaxID=1797530 RepID=A0A1G1XMG8_9BACT|nr:MAG: dTDP-4-dehydrorhamnose reductase [Candidatus Buchananbacteria bacterium RBG_13_36_9]